MKQISELTETKIHAIFKMDDGGEIKQRVRFFGIDDDNMPVFMGPCEQGYFLDLSEVSNFVKFVYEDDNGI